MTLWRIWLKPGRDKDDGRSFKFCLERGIIGVGWRIDEQPDNFEHYEKLGEEAHSEEATSWRRAINAIGTRMQTGDLVWTRSGRGVYYIGEISGDWEYQDKPENRDVDIHNVRPCKLFEVGTDVAGAIVNSCISPLTIQSIPDPTAMEYSTLMWRKIASQGAARER